MNNSISKEWFIATLVNNVYLSSGVPYTVGNTYCYPRTRIIGGFDASCLRIYIRYPEKSSERKEEKIFSVLTNGNFRKGNFSLIQPYMPEFLNKIAAYIDIDAAECCQPIEIVLPTLPFKCQNPLSTGHSPGFVDLGEYLLFSQLRDMHYSVREVYPPGVRFIMLSDGLVYADIFSSGDRKEAEEYRVNCVRACKEMNLSDAVNIVDMSWIVDQEPRFSETRNALKEMLVSLEKEEYLVQECMRSLRNAMRFNIVIPEYGFEDFSKIVRLEENELPYGVREKVRLAALQYASFLLAMSFLKVIQNKYPHAIRATVHSKSAPQIPLHLVNRSSVVAPYNGVPVLFSGKLKQSGDIRKSARIMKLYQLLQYKGVSAVYVGDAREPFYYIIGEE